MTKGSPDREPDPEIVYSDIFHLSRPVSGNHPKMSLYDRAAQFAPFAALTGFEDMIGEEARLVDNRIELSEEEIALLNQKLGRIADRIAQGERPTVTLTRFLPDPLKPGGRYETVTERVRRIDCLRQEIVLNRKTGKAGAFETVRMADVLEINS